MDVTPQPPQSSDPDRSLLDPSGSPASPSVPSAPSATAPAPPAPPPDPGPPAELPPPSLRTTLRRAALGAVAGAVLVTGAVVAVPDDEGTKAPPTPVPGSVSRALAATAAGSPVALADLKAL